MNRFVNALIETMNPKGGNGLGETVVLSLIIISITILAFNNKEIPDALMIIITAIGGVISGYKIGGNKKKGDEDGES